jgi:hypothetical protein
MGLRDYFDPEARDYADVDDPVELLLLGLGYVDIQCIVAPGPDTADKATYFYSWAYAPRLGAWAVWYHVLSTPYETQIKAGPYGAVVRIAAEFKNNATTVSTETEAIELLLGSARTPSVVETLNQRLSDLIDEKEAKKVHFTNFVEDAKAAINTIKTFHVVKKS